MAAYNARWGSVAKCASHPAWKSGCQADDKCEFLPYIDEWQLGSYDTYAKWNRLDGRKLTTTGTWTESYAVAAVPSLHECALLAAGVPTINSFNYNGGASTCDLLSGVEPDVDVSKEAGTLEVDAGYTFVEFFVPYELPAAHGHGACPHRPGTEMANNFKVSATDTISTCAAFVAEAACTAAGCEWKALVLGWQGALDTVAPARSSWRRYKQREFHIAAAS